MSFQEKFASIMTRPGQDLVAKDDVPWWMKYAGRSVGTVGSFIAIFLGIFTCTNILLGSVDCLIGGIWQILAGFVVICCEAPCCCMFVDHIQRLGDWVDSRPYWNRAAAYVVLALPAIILCPGVNTILGSGLIFTTGAIYGMMALGRKATAEEMRQQAVTTESTSRSSNGTGTNSNSMHVNLVTDAQPMSFTGPPMYSSNV